MPVPGLPTFGLGEGASFQGSSSAETGDQVVSRGESGVINFGQQSPFANQAVVIAGAVIVALLILRRR